MNVARREREMIKEVPTVTIYIKCFGGDVHDLEVETHMTISELKAMIESAAAIPAEEQHVYFEEHSQLQVCKRSTDYDTRCPSQLRLHEG